MSQDETTPEEAVNTSEETSTDAPTEQQAVQPEVQPEKTGQTVGELLQTEAPKKSEKPDSVPFDVFEREKKAARELKRERDELKQRLDAGESLSEVSDDIKSLAEEYNLDAGFLTKWAKAQEGRVRKELEAQMEAKLAPLTAKEKEAKINEAFTNAYNQTIEQMPEYKDIVKPEVIKALSLDPKNAKKTFNQIIEEAYGHVVTGKRTIETTKPGGGKEPQEIDFNRAKTDAEYYSQIMAEPTLKKKYNEQMVNRVANQI